MVIVGKLNDTNYRNCDVISVAKLGNMLLHLSQIYDPPNEVTLVIDMKGVLENNTSYIFYFHVEYFFHRWV